MIAWKHKILSWQSTLFIEISNQIHLSFSMLQVKVYLSTSNSSLCISHTYGSRSASTTYLLRTNGTSLVFLTVQDLYIDYLSIEIQLHLLHCPLIQFKMRLHHLFIKDQLFFLYFPFLEFKIQISRPNGYPSLSSSTSRGRVHQHTWIYLERPNQTETMLRYRHEKHRNLFNPARSRQTHPRCVFICSSIRRMSQYVFSQFL